MFRWKLFTKSLFSPTAKSYQRKPLRRKSSLRLLAEQLEAREVPAAFTPGDIAVYQVGDGVHTGSTAYPVFIDEYTPGGTLVQSIPVSAAGTNPLTSATSGSQSFLTDSGDGQALVLAGYDTAVGNSTSGTKTTIGEVNAGGNVDTSTVDTTTGLTVRSATANVAGAGGEIWLGTSTVGVQYTTFGTSGATTTVEGNTVNTRVVEISNGQLYISDDSTGGSNEQWVGNVGSGLPTVGPYSIGTIGVNNTDQLGGAYDYFFGDVGGSPTPNVLYVSGGDDIYKYTGSGDSWTADGSIADPFGSTDSTGITGTVSGNTITLYVTDGTFSAENQLYKVVDTSGTGMMSAGTATVTNPTTASSLEYFHGIALAPDDGAQPITGMGGTTNYSQGETPTTIAGSASFGDLSSFNGGSLTVSGTDSGDLLAIGTSGGITLASNNVFYNGTQIGTYSGGTNGSNLVVTFDSVVNTDGAGSTEYTVTSSAVQALMNDITFSTVAATGNRTVEFTVVKNGGVDSTSATQTVNVTATAALQFGLSSYSFTLGTPTTNGTVVGTVSASGGIAPVSYSILSGNTNNAFAINSSTGQITVNDMTQINYPSSSYNLTVQAEDSASPSNNTTTATVGITVVLNPVIPSGQSFSIDEGSSNGTPVGTISITPGSSGISSVSLIGGNTGGAFAIDNSGDISVANSSELSYLGTPGHAFTLTVQVTDSDGGVGTNTVTVDLLPTQVPTVSVNAGLYTYAGLTSTIGAASLSYTDEESTPVTYQLTVAPTGGTLYDSSSPLSDGDTFTQTDINDGNITYTAGATTGSDSFSFTVTDGMGNTTSTQTFAITIAPTPLPFTPGDIVVYRLGTGSVLGSAAAPVYLDEYTPSGVLVQSIGLPQTPGSGATINPLTGYTSGSQSFLTDSADGAALVLAGYDSPVGGSTEGNDQTIGEVNAGGNIDTTTVSTSDNGTVRSATANVAGAGGEIWLGTSSAGVQSTTFGTDGPTTAVSTSLTGRVVGIADGQLYADTETSFGTVGTGLPTSGSFPIVETVPTGGFASFGPYQFFFAAVDGSSTPNVLYVTNSQGGILKFTGSGSNWTADGSVLDPEPGSNEAVGITGTVSGNTVTLYVTDGVFSAENILETIVDSSGTGTLSSSATTIATAATNEYFHGVALAPDDGAQPITGLGGVKGYAQGATPIIVTDPASFSDLSSFNGGSLTVSGGIGSDVLAVSAGGTISLAAGNAVDYNGTQIGTYSGGSNLVITFDSVVNTNGTGGSEYAVTSAAIQDLMNQITFYTTGATGDRSIEFTVVKNGGVDSTSATETVDVVASLALPSFAQSSYNFSVSQSATNGSAVGTVAAVGGTAPLTYSIFSDTGSLTGPGSDAFTINPSTGQITLNDATQLQPPDGPQSFTMDVRVTDNMGNTADTTVDIVEDPAIAPGQSFTIDEALADTTTVGDVSYMDGSTAVTAFSITGGNGSPGAFAISSAGVISVANSSQLNYVTVPGHAFTLTVQATDSDGGTTSGTVTINLLPIYPPTETANAGLFLTAGTTSAIGLGRLSYAAEGGGSNVTYTLTSLPSAGMLFDNGSQLSLSPGHNTFTQAQINADDLTYTAGGSTAMDSFNFTVTDTHGNTTGTQTFDITITTTALTLGDLIIYREGNADTSLATGGNQVFLDEYTTAGVLVESIAMPSSAATNLIASGTAASEGQIELSANGEQLVLTGYDATIGESTNLPGSSTTGASAVARTVALVGASGSIDVSTTTTSFSAGNPRSAVADGPNIWMAGSNTGIVYTTDGSSGAGTVVSTDETNTRVIQDDNGQLYFSSGTGAGIYSLNTPEPTAPGTTGTATILPGLSTPSPYGFFFARLGTDPNTFNGYDTLYVADDGISVNGTTGGIEKWSWENFGFGYTWVEVGEVAAASVRGLTGEVVGGNVTLFGTTGGSSATGGGSLYAFTDTTGAGTPEGGGAVSGTAITIATALSDEAFRGISFAPTAPPTVTASAASQPSDSTTLTINGTGFDPSGTNTVAFNDGAVGTAVATSTTSLTVTFSTQPTAAGSLTAVVTTDGLNSGAPVQVATVTPVITLDSLTSPTSSEPEFSGTGGTTSLDVNSIYVYIYNSDDMLVETLNTYLTEGSTYYVSASPALASGMYTADATQMDTQGNNWTSNTISFTVASAPSVTASTTGQLEDVPTMTINGTGFDPAGTNTVTFNDGAVGYVSSVSATALTVTFSTYPTAAGSLTAVVTTDGASSASTQVATVSFVTAVKVNGDYAPIVDISSNGSGTVTVTTDGNNGFTANGTNMVTIAGYTGSGPTGAQNYNGTFVIQSASANTFTVTNAAANAASPLTSNVSGFAIGQNTSSALIGVQRSMVDSVAYTFSNAITLTAANFTLGTLAPNTSLGNAPLAPAPATNGSSMVLTSLSLPGGEEIWVVTWVTAAGNTVVGHSIADGVYQITLTYSNESTDTFYRLYGNVLGYNAGIDGAAVNSQDSAQFSHTDLLSTGTTGYLADLDYNADGVVNTIDAGQFSHRSLSEWTGFSPTI